MADALRIVTFNMLPVAYGLIAAWAARHGHQIVLLVTSPRDADRYGISPQQFVASLPPTQDVLITSRMRQIATPAIAALAPDLIIAATFPHRIPRALAAVPRFGALNLHPSPLPRGRGPNPQRLLYEGDSQLAATLHRIVPEFDAGPILSQVQRPLPEQLTPEELIAAWGTMLLETLEDGVPRAVAGEPGEPQDEALASYAAPFTEEERWLTWNAPARLLQQQVLALNLAAPTARAMVDGSPVTIAGLRPLRDPAPDVLPGTVIAHEGSRLIIRAADRAIEITCG